VFMAWPPRGIGNLASRAAAAQPLLRRQDLRH
jgi:hypothetical protein